jgi:hypothetical protein
MVETISLAFCMEINTILGEICSCHYDYFVLLWQHYLALMCRMDMNCKYVKCNLPYEGYCLRLTACVSCHSVMCGTGKEHGRLQRNGVTSAVSLIAQQAVRLSYFFNFFSQGICFLIWPIFLYVSSSPCYVTTLVYQISIRWTWHYMNSVLVHECLWPS